LDAAGLEHRIDGLDHQWRAAQIVLAILRRGVILKMAAEHHIVDESYFTGPRVGRCRLRERGRPAEVGVKPRQVVELLDIEQFFPAARAIPEADATTALLALQLVVD